MSPLDRAARALAPDDWAFMDAQIAAYPLLDPALFRKTRVIQRSLDQARAAIVALAKPSPEMQVAGHTAALAWADAHDVESHIYRTMLAKALEG